MKEVRVKITAEAIATVKLGENETVNDLNKRLVDIYLQDADTDDMINKEDLGGCITNVELIVDNKSTCF